MTDDVYQLFGFFMFYLILYLDWYSHGDHDIFFKTDLYTWTCTQHSI